MTTTPTPAWSEPTTQTHVLRLVDVNALFWAAGGSGGAAEGGSEISKRSDELQAIHEGLGETVPPAISCPEGTTVLPRPAILRGENPTLTYHLQIVPVEEGDVWGPERPRQRRAKTPSLATLALGQQRRCATPGTSIWEQYGKRPASCASLQKLNEKKSKIILICGMEPLFSLLFSYVGHYYSRVDWVVKSHSCTLSAFYFVAVSSIV